MKHISRRILSILLSIQLIGSLFLAYPQSIFATTGLLDTASVKLSDPRPSQSGATYTGAFNIGSTATIKCINIVFAVNADMSGGVPTALTTTSATKGTLTGTGVTNTNWALYATNNGTLQFENSTGESHTAADAITAVPAITITNTSSSTFYAQITTYGTLNSHTCSGQVDQSNVMALVTTAGVTTTVTVQPTLSFSVTNYGSAVNGSGDTSPVTTTSTTIPLGTVAAGATSWGSQTLTVSTNAKNGYALYVRDTQALTDSASDTIRDQAGTPTAPQSFDGSSSQSSFGYTADGNGVVFGSNKWAGLTQSNVAIATRTGPISADATHAEFKVEPSDTQQPGTYSTVITYTATPSY